MAALYAQPQGPQIFLLKRGGSGVRKRSSDATHASSVPPSSGEHTTARVVDVADASELVEPAVPATEELPWDWARVLGIVENAQMDFYFGGVFFPNPVSSCHCLHDGNELDDREACKQMLAIIPAMRCIPNDI